MGFFCVEKVSFFVDGFNLYYSLKEASQRDPQHRCFKWLDLKKYLTQFLRPTEVLQEIFYFSAFYPWKSNHPLKANPSKEIRHRVFKQAIEPTGIKTFFGHFQKKTIYCPLCRGGFERPEEKKTDVHIASVMIREAVKNSFDTATLVSGDTDFAPAIEVIKELYPSKRVAVLFPFRRVNDNFKPVAHYTQRTKLANVVDCLFPDPLILPGGSLLSCPPEWK